MRIDRIAAAGERGVSAAFHPRSVTAMFGQNDAGKTNLLDVVAEVLTMGPESSRPSSEKHAPVPGRAIVTATADQRPHDDRALASLLQYGFISPPSHMVRTPEVFWWGGDEPQAAIDRCGEGPRPLEELQEAYAQELVGLADGMMPISLARTLCSGRTFHAVMYDLLYFTAPPARDWSPDDGHAAAWLEQDLGVARWIRRILKQALARPDHPAVLLWIVEDRPGLFADYISLWDFRRSADQRTLLDDDAYWLNQHPTGAQTVSTIATRIAPPLVRRRYSIEVVAQPFGVYAVDNDSGRRIELDLLGRGTAVWVDMAVRLAVAGFVGSAEAGVDPSVPWLTFVAEGERAEPERTPVLIFDEPERHLHPTAQIEVAAWLSNLSRAGAQVLVATHSPRFLRYPVEDVLLLGVQRSRKTGLTRARPLTRTLEAFDAQDLEGLGLDPADALLLLRGVLLVEGDHDVRFLRQRYGDQLDQAGVMVLPMHGHANALTIPDLELLPLLQVPVTVLLDRATHDHVDGQTRRGDMPDEARTLVELRRRFDAAGRSQDFRMVEHGLHDIIAAIGDEAVRKTVGEEWPGWRSVEEDYQRASRGPKPTGNFKTYAAKAAGITGPKAGSRFAYELLAHVSHDTPVSPTAERVLNQVLAQLTPQYPDDPVGAPSDDAEQSSEPRGSGGR